MHMCMHMHMRMCMCIRCEGWEPWEGLWLVGGFERAGATAQE